MSSIASISKVYTIGSGILENRWHHMYANKLVQLNRGGGARGNKSEGLAQEVHRRHPPLGGGGPQRRVDRQRPRYQPFVGAVVPLAQCHLPPPDDFDAVRPARLLLLRRGARARRPRRLVRPRDRQRPPLAQTLEEHREGRAAPHTYQDRLPEGVGAPGARRRPVSERFGTPRPAASAWGQGIWRLVSICSRNVLDPAAAVASLRRARSKRAHNASLGNISIGPGPCVLPRTPLWRSSKNTPVSVLVAQGTLNTSSLSGRRRTQ